MGKFVKHYALEIYTVLAMLFMVITSMMDGLSDVQRFVVVFNFLFILHEWEEGAYPGGFIDLISSLIGKELTDDLRRASRIPTSILLISITLVPFIFDDTAMFAVSIATFGIFEGLVHTLGIKIFRLKRKYTPRNGHCLARGCCWYFSLVVSRQQSFCLLVRLRIGHHHILCGFCHHAEDTYHDGRNTLQRLAPNAEESLEKLNFITISLIQMPTASITLKSRWALSVWPQRVNLVDSGLKQLRRKAIIPIA